MSTTTAPPPYLNGNSVAPAEARREVDFLQKILQIRDEVLASKHPRIHLPSKVLEQVAPRSTHPTLPNRPPTNGTPNGVYASQSLPSRPESSLHQLTPAHDFVSPVSPQRPFSTKSISSGIDPVLLTKSDQLIKAELNLKRLQIERALKDQQDKKGRANELAEDRETHFNVEEFLNQAQQRVKPVSGLHAPAVNSDGAESFDENSYYSSKADSWSSEDFDPNRNPSADAAEPLTSQAKFSNSGAPLSNGPSKQADHTVIDLDEEPYEPADDIEVYEPQPIDPLEEGDESDYSPPPADIETGDANKSWGRGRGNDTQGGMSRSSRRQSPNGPVPPIQNKRKRRREEKREEKQRQASKRAVRSPEPYIKEEPQSPPPFASYPETQPSKRRALQPLNDVEVVSVPRDSGRAQPIYYREQESSMRPYRQYEEPLSPSVVRVPQRRPERDDQDLRRVASLQYARRPHSPSTELYAAAEPRQIRAASHAFADRSEQPVYREASVRPSAAPRYIQERSRSPVHEYHSRLQSPMVMAPPPRRIVVDEFGNKYYAAPVEARESAAPPSRRIVVDPYYERATTREPTMRAPARPEIYEEENVQRMPPPPPRRYMEASEAEIVQARPLRQREASHRPIEVEYRPQEIIERRPMAQYDERGPPREYLPSRAFSVRPEVIRREAPEGYVRHESVQPSHLRAAVRHRELSVAHPDPYDDGRYAFAAPAPQTRRYMEEGAALERPVEVAQELYSAEPRRVSYRY